MTSHLITLPDTTDLTDLEWTVDEACEELRGEFFWDDGDAYNDDNVGELFPNDDFGHGEGCYVTGWARVKATLPDGREVFFDFPWRADGDASSYMGMWDLDPVFDEDNDEWYDGGAFDRNFVLIDEDGDELELCHGALADLVKTQIDWETAVRDILPRPPKPEDIDTGEEGDATMERITLKRDNDRDLTFTGDLVAEASSARAMRGDKSTGRWTELQLYRTAGGKMVGATIGRTQWQGEVDRFAAAVCDDDAAVIEFFGHGWLAKDLYSEAGIDDVEEVD